jgi:hypothetical protein
MYSRVYAAHAAYFYEDLYVALFVIDQGFDAALDKILELNLACDHVLWFQFAYMAISTNLNAHRIVDPRTSC